MKRIIIDASLCTGCLNCTMACVSAHSESQSIYNLKQEDYANPPRNRIYQLKGVSYPVFCRNCKEPDCVNACMSGALAKDVESGLVVYDESLCAKCFMCVMACRYGHPRPAAKLDKVIRCDFCRNTEEKEPQCEKACPVKSIVVREVEE